jgi:putative nucleotidyltransferase with HDIG domain
MDRPVVVRIATFLATVVAAWGILSVGSSAAAPNLEVGDPAPLTYNAQRSASVVDTVETDRLKQEARDSVDPIFVVHPEIEADVIDQVNSVFDATELLVIGEPPESPPTTLPDPTSTTSTTGGGSSTTQGNNKQPATISGVLFIDVDHDGQFQPNADGPRVDKGLARVSVSIHTASDTQNVTTDADGVWTAEIDEGTAVVTVDDTDADIPNGYIIGGDTLSQEITCDPGDECEASPMGFVVNLRPLEDVTQQVTADFLLEPDTISVLAATASDDVIRAALGEPLHLTDIRQAALQRVLQEFGTRITPDQLPEAKARQSLSPPLVFHSDTGRDTLGEAAAGDIVSTFLQANYLVDLTLTESARNDAAEQVEPVEVEYTADQVIVQQGEIVTQLDIDAGIATGAFVDPVQAQGGLLAVIAILVGLLGLYLARFRPEFWARPRMVALLGILIVLAAGSVRLTVAVEAETSWYVLPAAMFGLITAVLFDSRIAVLMAISVGVLTAVGTQDIGITVYAVLATMAPIPFVSSVSTRAAFRNAVIFAGLAAAVAAAATAWFFHVGPNDDFLQVMGTSAVWAFGVSVIASLVGLAALQFFESAFDVTTALGLLDLTDRNHEALLLLQEHAFGTFNHSLMVGTLAHAAARAIGANALLARAMAYYHDIGKTENPTYFIENQFGIPNPHDLLSPYESAEIIRKHVTDGVALARQFKIPSDVATGIVCHHGDGVMRYFYEKARREFGEDVDPNDFRHVGHKPRTAETAIVMLADSLEAACRAVFQTEEPTPEAIQKVVNRIIDEKVNDGQLEESPLTLAELTLIRSAFLDSLVGHYHQRIAYPDFSVT